MRAGHGRAAQIVITGMAAIHIIGTNDPRTGSKHIKILPGQFAGGEIGHVIEAYIVWFRVVNGIPPRTGLPFTEPACRADGDHRLIRAGIAHAGFTVIPGGCHDDYACFNGIIDGRFFNRIQGGTTQGHIDHNRVTSQRTEFQVGNIGDTPGDHGGPAGAVLVQDFHRNNSGQWGHAVDRRTIQVVTQD